MRKLLEKLFIIIFCLYNTYKINTDENLAFYLLISLIISFALEIISNKKFKAILYTSFVLICLYDNLFTFYLPLILYDMCLDFSIYSLLTIPLVFMSSSFINLLTSIFSVYLAIMTDRHNHIIDENKITRDKLKEDSLYLEKYNKQLKIDKEKNIHIAILTERNRIGKQLHDSIGHAISSSILQVESLKILSNESNMVKGLDILQKTLLKGMDDIRKSIHNLYNESLDLENQIKKLCTHIPNIDVELSYKIDNDLSYAMKFDFLSVVKEGITNCIKHSNATKLNISLLEQPKFYKIIIKDDGSNFDEVSLHSPKGIGLISIKEIADKYNGFLNYKFDKGFKIHLTLMKG